MMHLKLFYLFLTTQHLQNVMLDSIDLKRTMGTIILALIPCLIFGCYNIGYQYYSQFDISYINQDFGSFFNLFLYGLIKVTPMIIVSYGVGLSIEFAFAVLEVIKLMKVI